MKSVARSFSRMLGVALLAGALGAAAMTVSSDSEAATLEANGRALKTPPMSGRTEAAFRKAVADLESAPKSEQAEKTKTVRVLGTALRAEVAAFVAQLRANHEDKAFDSLALARAKVAGGSLASDLGAAGGAVALLETDPVGAVLRDLETRNASLREAAFGDELVSVQRGKVSRTFCTAWWWVVSVGEATEIAYVSCLKD